MPFTSLASTSLSNHVSLSCPGGTGCLGSRVTNVVHMELEPGHICLVELEPEGLRSSLGESLGPHFFL